MEWGGFLLLLGYVGQSFGDLWLGNVVIFSFAVFVLQLMWKRAMKLEIILKKKTFFMCLFAGY